MVVSARLAIDIHEFKACFSQRRVELGKSGLFRVMLFESHFGIKQGDPSLFKKGAPTCQDRRFETLDIELEQIDGSNEILGTKSVERPHRNVCGFNILHQGPNVRMGNAR